MEDFSDLLDIEPVSHKQDIAEWEGDIPENVSKFVHKVAASGKPHPIKVTQEGANRYKSVVKAAATKHYPEKSASFRDRYSKADADGNGGGEYHGFTFSLGERRGRKSAE